MLHGIILSFGGIPLLYYGDEIGVTNDFSYLQNHDKQADNRWVHRPIINWHKAELRHQEGSIEAKIFNGIKHLIAVRKAQPVFADFNNRVLLELNNPALFAYSRFDVKDLSKRITVLANFSAEQHFLKTDEIEGLQGVSPSSLINAITGKEPEHFQNDLILKPYELLYLCR
mgnify:CR=1 FL=1